jgi:hypothetical protein
MWQTVGDAALDIFFGVSAVQWSAKKWRELQAEDTTGVDGS